MRSVGKCVDTTHQCGVPGVAAAAWMLQYHNRYHQGHYRRNHQCDHPPPRRFRRSWSGSAVACESRDTCSSRAGFRPSRRNRRTGPWSVGDWVTIPSQNNVTGQIGQVRGGGWYTVRPVSMAPTHSTMTTIPTTTTSSSATDALFKVRGSQLRRFSLLQESRDDHSLNASSSSSSSSSSSFRLDPPPPPPTMINLDAVLHHHKTPSPHHQIDTDAVQNPRDAQYLEQVAHHATFSKWVVFTDLHCAPTTLATTLHVLQTVHRLAQERHAGILFLGDWWHHRGTLRVDCLNAILQELSTNWTQPMILIPGNHDQITLRGHEHALTPLEQAYRCTVAVPSPPLSSSPPSSVPGPLIFSHPTLFRNALFIPHIRDHATMEAVLQSPLAQNDHSNHDDRNKTDANPTPTASSLAQTRRDDAPPSDDTHSYSMETHAIFCHADVTGAYMNDQIISLGGVPPYLFPPRVRIYSGHFHKPHTVTHASSGVSIEYLGSPYQVSLSEAQQQKALVVLDADQGWNCIERIPIDIGRRHFRLQTIPDFLNVQLESHGTREPGQTTDQWTTETFPSHGVTEHADADANADEIVWVRPGDRIVVSLDKHILDDYYADDRWNGNGNTSLDRHATALRRAGVAVELREIKKDPLASMWGNRTEQAFLAGMPATTTTTTMEELTPTSIWRTFLQEQIRREALSNATAESLLPVGLELLTEIDGNRTDEDNDDSSNFVATSIAGRRWNGTDLELLSVSVEGFGPFRQSVTYPLVDRGLVLLRGTNKDGGTDR